MLREFIQYKPDLEESRNIKLPLGDIGMKPELGVYYIDMRPARIHYEVNIWGGKFDENGVPMIKSGGSLIYYPINIAQYGFILHAEWLEKREESKFRDMMNCLNILEALKSEDGEKCVWWHQSPHNKYGLKPPWASAMAQGELISFYLRLYQAGGGEKLLDTARKSYEFMKTDVADKGVRISEENGNPWLEEYPSDPPSYVLNGFIYAIFGMFDLYRITRREDLKRDIDRCLNSLRKKLPQFTTSYWSLYDLRKKELVRYYYQKNVHIPQMEVLYRLTGDEIFRHFKEKWERQLTPLNFLFVRLMYRMRPRLQRLLKLWNHSITSGDRS